MRKFVIFCLISALINESFAVNPEFDAVVNLARQDGQSRKMHSYHYAKQFHPKNIFKNYTDHPEQEKYYEGATQKNTMQMDADKNQIKNNESGKQISEGIKNHPRYVINSSDSDMQHSTLLQDEAYNIVHGMTSQYIDCKPKEICTVEYQEQQCSEAPQAILPSCKRKLNIDIIPHEQITHYLLSAHLAVKDHDYAGVSVNAVNGRTDFLGPHDASFTMDGRLPASIDCRTLTGKIISSRGGAHLDNISFPSCSTGLNLNFHISGGHNLDLKMDVTSKVVTTEVRDNWMDDCASIAADASCRLRSENCDIQGSTQIIQGISVTRDCWEQKRDYICRNGSGEGTCKPLQIKGCEQIGSECEDKTNGQCSLYHQTYRCPTKSCSPTTDVVCGNGQEYCLDGNCTDKNYQQSQDFGNAVSVLSGAIEAGREFDQGATTIFTGHASECSEKPIGYSNCCTETGWGHDIGLDHCPEAAKKLHADRENKLAIKVGRYCVNKVANICLEYSQVFCVFGSKLAKIIQEQGRNGQLHIHFGDPEEPKCDGITPKQLQTLDFSKMDFQDFINDVSKKVKNPDLKQIQDLIQQHVQQSQVSGLSNG